MCKNANTPHFCGVSTFRRVCKPNSVLLLAEAAISLGSSSPRTSSGTPRPKSGRGLARGYGFCRCTLGVAAQTHPHLSTGMPIFFRLSASLFAPLLFRATGVTCYLFNLKEVRVRTFLTPLINQRSVAARRAAHNLP